MNEYIIVNKTAIQKRIEELEKEIEFYDKVGALSINPNKVKAETELSLLKQILSQSTPLLSEIEKFVDLIKWYDENSDVRPTEEYPTENGNSYEWFEDYISNLKLDI